MWSFVFRKGDACWIWLAQCRRTRQVVGWATSDRSEATCRGLWDNIPDAYKQSVCYSDFWKAYAAVIPPEQHRPVGKESGQTNHHPQAGTRRFNNTLRRRVGRLVRKTLSFSKTETFHRAVLWLFLNRYNQERLLKIKDATPG
jgi:insertion element IS1 protein InsB